MADQFYVSKQDLLNLIEKFNNIPMDDHSFEGFVMQEGLNDENKRSWLFNPAYLKKPDLKVNNNDEIITNTSGERGCPYPPGYN